MEKVYYIQDIETSKYVDWYCWEVYFDYFESYDDILRKYRIFWKPYYSKRNNFILLKV